MATKQDKEPNYLSLRIDAAVSAAVRQRDAALNDAIALHVDLAHARARIKHLEELLQKTCVTETDKK